MKGENKKQLSVREKRHHFHYLSRFPSMHFSDNPQIKHIPIAGKQGERCAAGRDPGAAVVVCV